MSINRDEYPYKYGKGRAFDKRVNFLISYAITELDFSNIPDDDLVKQLKEIGWQKRLLYSAGSTHPYAVRLYKWDYAAKEAVYRLRKRTQNVVQQKFGE